MSEAVKNRAAAIRDYLGKIEPAIDPALIYRYSVTAAWWEALRVLIDRGDVTPANDRRFTDLGGVLRSLTEKVGLETWTDDRGAEGRRVKSFHSAGIPGLTSPAGYLPHDPSRIVAETWQEAAEGW
jgi:hypothetical protein